MIGKTSGKDPEVVRVAGGWLVASLHGDVLVIDYIAEATAIAERLSLPLFARALFRSDNRLFAVTERGLTEVTLSLFGKPVLAVGGTWSATPASTRFFDGFGVYDALGAKFILLPFGDSACAVVRAPEIDGLVPINGKSCGRFVVMTVVTAKGEYERLTFTFDHEYGSYAFARTVVDSPELNLAILPKGVVASIEDDGELVVFVPTSGKVVKVPDKHILADMTLARTEDQVLYIKDGALWSVRMH